MSETTTPPCVNSEVDRWELETYPQILAVVDRDGDVWTRDPDAADGDVWVWWNADGYPAEFATAAQLAQYGPLRVAWVQR